MRRSIKKFFTISTIAFVILYPCLFMYFQNADEAKLIDALPAFEKFLALAIVVFVDQKTVACPGVRPGPVPAYGAACPGVYTRGAV